MTIPSAGNEPPKRYTNVLTLNTAGSNLLLFACPDPNALISWSSALRLASWEKARLEEIYTAHLIRINLRGQCPFYRVFSFFADVHCSAPNIPTTLQRGRMEGWVQVRVAGQTDWKKIWMVISSSNDSGGERPASVSGPSNGTQGKMRRMSNLFTGPRDASPTRSGLGSPPMISMYTSPKPKDKKKPLLTMSAVTQAFAVYPERPELISRSTLIKVEGLLGEEETAAGMKNREGWLLIMLDVEASASFIQEMLKWVLGSFFCHSLVFIS